MFILPQFILIKNEYVNDRNYLLCCNKYESKLYVIKSTKNYPSYTMDS